MRERSTGGAGPVGGRLSSRATIEVEELAEDPYGWLAPVLRILFCLAGAGLLWLSFVERFVVWYSVGEMAPLTTTQLVTYWTRTVVIAVAVVSVALWK